MARGEDAEDHNLPKILWLAVEPLVRGNPAQALDYAGRSNIPMLAQFIARRAVDADNAAAVVAEIAKSPKSVAALLEGQWDRRYPRAPEVLRYGRYGEHLDRYLEHFPAEQLLVFDQHQLVKDAASSLRRAFAFVGVDEDFVLPERTVRASNTGVYSPLRLRLRIEARSKRKPST